MTHTKMAFILTAIISFMVGASVGNFGYAMHVEKNKAKEIVQAPPKKEPNWNSIEDIELEYDMEKANVTLVKRSFNEDGIEATYVEYGTNEKRYFMCSRDIHKKLVHKFQELLKKRNAEGF
jgi:hypothetical protein